MEVRDVMTRTVLTIGATETTECADLKMSQAGVHQLVVRGTHGKVVGVIGRRDLSGAPRTARVADFMHRRLVSVGPDAQVGRAAALMRAHALGSLPVMSGARLVGIVTVSDMLAVLEEDERVPDKTAARRQKPVN